MKKVIQTIKRNKLRLLLILLLAPAAVIFCGWLAGEFLIIRKPLPTADVAYVLSGNLYWGERSHRAGELYREGRVKKIALINDNIQAGWEASIGRNPYYWEWERWYLIGQGVAESDIEILPGVTTGTQSEAVLLANAARARGWRSAVVVTSPLHTRRTFWVMQRVFSREKLAVELGIEPARHPQSETYWWTKWRNWQMLGGEYLKFIYYWLFY